MRPQGKAEEWLIPPKSWLILKVIEKDFNILKLMLECRIETRLAIRIYNVTALLCIIVFLHAVYMEIVILDRLNQI